MKTGKETTAGIASDVRKAIRERVEYQYTEDLARKKELEKEEMVYLRDLEKVRKEKRSTFYYAIAMLFLTSSGIGGLSPFFTDTSKSINWYSVVGGIVLTLYFAAKANNELKR